jgi:hypothetical protein
MNLKSLIPIGRERNVARRKNLSLVLSENHIRA